MVVSNPNEIIVVRSLTNSDLGLFAAHRDVASSKQRAININSQIAQRLLSKAIFENNGTKIDCDLIFSDHTSSSKRHIGKVGKNWRLGGNKIEGEVFGKLHSKDFVIIRSIENNDGSQRFTILFISRTIERSKHARIVRLVEPTMKDSMEIYREGSAGFQELSALFPIRKGSKAKNGSTQSKPINIPPVQVVPPMPHDELPKKKSKTIKEKLQSTSILEQMLKVSSDLSAPAQVSFMDTVGKLAEQLRTVLIASNRIIRLEKNHPKAWRAVEGQYIGFVDGGLANLSMFGSAPIAARAGGYIVRPGDKSQQRERFIMLKKLINELFSSNGGVYDGSFPDVGALRDAARISVEAAGAVRLLKEEPSLSCLFLHGALVNPVSRYTDIMRDGKPNFHFPNFSEETQIDFNPSRKPVAGRDSNFISVYLHQLEELEKSSTSICGVVEREATTSSVIRSVLNSLEDPIITPHLPVPPEEWKEWFRGLVDPTDEGDNLGQRITDSLLFRCVLEPGEALVPVEIDRNEMRRAPLAWQDIIHNYPKPLVSYLQPNEWSPPIRLEIFKRDLKTFERLADLILHCSLLLPRYAFPAGLDIVDKFAKIPNWMSRPVNTNTAVQALKKALHNGDEKLFDSLRRMLCGSNREWLLRPGLLK